MNTLATRASMLIAGGLLVLVASTPLAAQRYHGMLARYNSLGALDTTFAGDGSIVTTYPGTVYYSSVLLQGNGKITVGGTVEDAQGVRRQHIGRVTDLGDPDMGFGYFGVTGADYPSATHEVVAALAFDKNLKIVAAVSADGSVSRGWLLERFHTNGALDTTFGSAGFRAVNFDYANSAVPYGIAMYTRPSPPPLDYQTIAVVGTVNDPVITGDDFGVSLHAENGDLLTSFSGDGKQRVNTSYHDIATSVTFDTQGNVLVAGSTFIENQDRMTVVRLKPNGDLDPAFGQGGIARVKFPGVKQSVAYGVTRDSWNRVVLAGFAYTNAGVFHIAVARLKADGKLDETFSQDGMVMKLCPGASSAMARAVTLDPTASPTSNISVTGQAIYGGLIQVSLARFTHTGELDPYFGADSNGCVHTSFPPDLSAGNAIGVTAFGKSVVAGFTLTQ